MKKVSWNSRGKNAIRPVQGWTSSLPVSLRGQFLSLASGLGRKEGGVERFLGGGGRGCVC